MPRKPAATDEFSEDAIRARARHIWEREGCPEGRALDHWQMARSELAMEAGVPAATEPNPAAEREEAPRDQPVEPIEAVENQGAFPGLADQDEEQQYPRRRRTARRAERKL
ncbi:DUF2934 domain-containing protein [Magnetospirillum sp. UT-4]|uniref:DUF2934 domain-containing protein n=1 Tax=Magnetospirillum sp. UT-4 TaxID=2681467 RepID=UPI001385AEAD|nr:DUF2934 domain-containing protein [Magnetospirillum sp. UT-4]CAA7627109.1 conserved hypothetical protein [Magnetospirillum sp. UT-4]